MSELDGKAIAKALGELVAERDRLRAALEKLYAASSRAMCCCRGLMSDVQDKRTFCTSCDPVKEALAEARAVLKTKEGT